MVGPWAGATEPSLDEGDVGAQLPGVAGFEVADLEFDDDVAQLLDVEQEQVDDELLAAADVEGDLPAR